MTPLYAPAVVNLVEALVAVVEEGASPEVGLRALQQARERHLQSQNLMALQMSSLHAFPELRGLHQDMQGLLSQRETFYEALERQLAEGRTSELAASARKLQELSYVLALRAGEVERQRMRMPMTVPFQVLDGLLRTARAVAQGQENPVWIHAWLPLCVDWLQSLRREGESFAQAYPEETQLTSRFGRALAQVQEGLGALAEGMVTEGLELLPSAGLELGQLLAAQQQARAQSGLSRFPDLDHFGRAARGFASGGLDQEGFDRALQQLLESVRRRRQALAEESESTLLLPNQRATHQDLLERHRTMEDKLQQSGRDDRSLLSLFRQLQELFKEGAQPLLRRSLEQEPLWEEVREAVVAWYAGQLPSPFVLVKRDQTLREIAQTQLELAGQADESLLEACLRPAQLLEELPRVLRDRGEASEWLKSWEDTYDRWLWVKDSLQQLQQQKGRQNCLRCGHSNERQRQCARCGFPLPWQEEEIRAEEVPSSAFSAQLVQARQKGATLAELQPMLRRWGQVSEEAQKRLKAWHSQFPSPEGDLAELAPEVSGALEDIRAIVGELLSQDAIPSALLERQLDLLCDQLDWLASTQEQLSQEPAEEMETHATMFSAEASLELD